MAAMERSVWFLLGSEKSDKVRGIFVDVADFRDAVKAKMTNALSHCDAADLRVFLSADEYKAKKAALDDQAKEPEGVRAGLTFPLSNGAGTEEDKALYVVAPVKEVLLPAFDWRFRAPPSSFDFLPSPAHQQLTTNLVNDAMKIPSHDGTRYYYWYPVLGSSGRGKTRTAVEAVRAAQAQLQNVVHTIAGHTLCAELVASSADATALLGLRILVHLLTKCFSPPGLEFRDCTVNHLRAIESNLVASFFPQHMNPPPTVCFLILDEFQECPNTTSALLRGIRDWHLSMRKSLSIIPIFPGTSSLGLDLIKLCKASGYQAIPTTVSLLYSQEEDPFYPLLRKAYPPLAAAQDDMIRRLCDHLGRWPIAYEFLLTALRTTGYTTFTVEECQTLYCSVKEDIQKRYARVMATIATSQAMRTILLFSACQHQVLRSSALNGGTWASHMDSGHYTLVRRSLHKSNASDMDEDKSMPYEAASTDDPDGTKYLVKVPFILWVVLNNKLQRPLVCPSTLDPFKTDWETIELMSIASLQLRVAYLLSQGNAFATPEQLRPSATIGAAVAQVQIPLCELEFNPDTCLTASVSQYVGRWRAAPNWYLPIETGLERTLHDMANGGLYRGIRTQQGCEMACVLANPAVSPNRVAWFTQCKAKDILNRDGQVTQESNVSVSAVSLVQHDLLKLVAHVPFMAVVIDWFSMHHPWKRGSTPECAVVTTLETIPDAVGPVFAQRVFNFQAMQTLASAAAARARARIF